MVLGLSRYKDDAYRYGNSYHPNYSYFDPLSGVYFYAAFFWLFCLVFNISLLWCRRPRNGEDVDPEIAEYQRVRKQSSSKEPILVKHSESEREFITSRRELLKSKSTPLRPANLSSTLPAVKDVQSTNEKMATTPQSKKM
ncbi:unnamed protein product, partial [Mesorhabditis belari]|uniref:Uncharacterized protein n=1 Tax=Mesorhabditis belari TaxID=2138241 RepID=A0AAF3F4K6_9BILA